MNDWRTLSMELAPEAVSLGGFTPLEAHYRKVRRSLLARDIAVCVAISDIRWEL